MNDGPKGMNTPACDYNMETCPNASEPRHSWAGYTDLSVFHKDLRIESSGIPVHILLSN